MNSALSHLARRLQALPMPILCRTEAERAGVEQAARASAECVGRGHAWDQAARNAEWAAAEAAQQEQDARAAEILALAGGVMQRLATTGGLAPAEAAYATWIAFYAEDPDWKDPIGPAPAEENPAVETPRTRGNRVARRLEHCRGVLADIKSPVAAHAARAADAWLALDREQLAALEADCPPGFIAEFLECSDSDPCRGLLSPPDVARARDRAAAAAEKARAARTEAGPLQAEADRLKAVFLQTLPGLTAHLPGTGETADLAALLRITQQGLTDQQPFTDDVRPFSCRNRVFARLAVWLAIADIRWTPAAREVLAELVQRPRVFVRWQPRDAAGRDTKTALRDLRGCFIGHRPPEEIKSLLQIIHDPGASDEEIAWAVGEFVLSRYARDGAIAEMGAIGEKLERALFNLMGAHFLHYTQLFVRLQPYDGTRHLRTAVDAEIERLEAEEAAHSVSSSFTYRPFTPPVPPPAPAPAPRSFTLRYLLNPHGRVAHYVTATCTIDTAVATIKALLDAHGKAPEPSASLAEAIFHFAFEMAKEHRHTWEKERVGAHVFHKVRRAHSRLYIRVEEPVVTFHVYPRRDWERPGVA